MTITRKQKWEEKQLRENESLLIAAQNNTIRTNIIKARIDKTKQNSKCTLLRDRDETINDIISECSKLALKEYKTLKYKRITYSYCHSNSSEKSSAKTNVKSS